MRTMNGFVIIFLTTLGLAAAGPSNLSAQTTPISKSLSACVMRGNVSHLTIRADGKLSCDEKGPILWVRANENQTDGTPLIQTLKGGDLALVNRLLGPIHVPAPLTIDNRSLSRLEAIQDDQKRGGRDLFVDKFAIERGGIVIRIQNGKRVPKKFVDTEQDLKRQDKDENMVSVNASDYTFYPFALVDEANAGEFRSTMTGWDLNNMSERDFKNDDGQVIAKQIILSGTNLCTKPKKKFGMTVGSRTRAYISNREPVQYCYGDTRGIDLPPNIGNGALTALLVMPYSQTSTDGLEDDNAAVWSSIPKSEIDRAQYILLTTGEKPGFPRIVIGLTKRPVPLK